MRSGDEAARRLIEDHDLPEHADVKLAGDGNDRGAAGRQPLRRAEPIDGWARRPIIGRRIGRTQPQHATGLRADPQRAVGGLEQAAHLLAHAGDTALRSPSGRPSIAPTQDRRQTRPTPDADPRRERSVTNAPNDRFFASTIGPRDVACRSDKGHRSPTARSCGSALPSGSGNSMNAHALVCDAADRNEQRRAAGLTGFEHLHALRMGHIELAVVPQHVARSRRRP